MNGEYHNDQASSVDQLGREDIAKTLANLAKSCETPIVIGLYGTWGSGKTSLMQQIKIAVEEDGFLTVWFNPWRHQFNEFPAVSLLQLLNRKFTFSKEIKKALTVAISAFGSTISKAATGLSLSELIQLGEHYEDTNFEVREVRDRLFEYFQRTIEQIIQQTEHKRIIFFIDDLDRCMPNHIVSMLEALKLFLDIPGCIYFLGVDHDALNKAIGERYENLGVTGTNYYR